MVDSIAFSLDGTRIASSSLDETTRLWDAKTGDEVMVFTRNIGSDSKVIFSPDGTRIVMGSSGRHD